MTGNQAASDRFTPETPDDERDAQNEQFFISRYDAPKTSGRRKLLIGAWIYCVQAFALVLVLGGVLLNVLNPHDILVDAFGTLVAMVGGIGVLTGFYFVGHAVSS